MKKIYPVIDLAATGRNILRLRKEHGLSVSDLQEYFGFDAPQAIYKWQRGQSLPSTDNLYALGYLLGVTVDDILVSRNTGQDKLPQEQSCGNHHFWGFTALLYKAFRLSAGTVTWWGKRIGTGRTHT